MRGAITCRICIIDPRPPLYAFYWVDYSGYYIERWPCPSRQPGEHISSYSDPGDLPG